MWQDLEPVLNQHCAKVYCDTRVQVSPPTGATYEVDVHFDRAAFVHASEADLEDVSIMIEGPGLTIPLGSLIVITAPQQALDGKTYRADRPPGTRDGWAHYYLTEPKP